MSHKTQVCHFILSLHHPHNGLENISIFYFQRFKSVAKKKILSKQNIEKTFGPLLPPFKVRPMPARVWNWFGMQAYNAKALYHICKRNKQRKKQLDLT